jgi:hypothetical protein
LQKVVEAFGFHEFYDHIKKFLVTQGRFITDDKLIHMKEDPLSMLYLYKLYMLQFITQRMTYMEKKFSTRQRKKLRPHTSHPLIDEKDESDYSDGDF